MPALLEHADRPMSLHDVAAISRQLADDLQRLPLRSEGFTVDDYLSLDGNYRVEFAHGYLQVLPMPDRLHIELQLIILAYLRAWAREHDALADAVLSPFMVRLDDSRFREPDVCLMLGKHRDRRSRKMWEGADLVVEVVSESNRDHDLVTKRREYAAHGIPEYWIVDPAGRSVTVLTLSDAEYAEHGTFAAGQTLTSPLLAGLTIDVGATFAEAERQAS